MAWPPAVPAKGYPHSLVVPLGGLARRLREKSETVPPSWVEEADQGMRQGKVLAWLCPGGGEPVGLLLLTPRNRRVFAHIFLTREGRPELEGGSLASTLVANLPEGTRRLDLTVSCQDPSQEGALGRTVHEVHPTFRAVERQRMARKLDPANPPPPYSLPPRYVFRWAADLDLQPLADLDFRAFEASPDRGLVAETPLESRRILGEMLRGELAPFLKDGSPAIVPDSERERPVGFLLSLQQGADAALIADVAIAPEARRQGLGAALLVRALRGLLARGMTEVSLWVTCENRPAVLLYERFEFTVQQREPIFIWERPVPAGLR